MKIELLVKDAPSNIMDFVTRINKTDNLTACIGLRKTKDGYYVIQVESMEED